HRADQPATPVFPREGTWVMGPWTSSPRNVLTIDIPPAWADTSPKGSIGPNIWVRTGCRYDIAANIAQCETGGLVVYTIPARHKRDRREQSRLPSGISTKNRHLRRVLRTTKIISISAR